MRLGQRPGGLRPTALAGGAPRGAGLWVWLLVLAAPLPAWSIETPGPCGGLEMRGGEVIVGHALGLVVPMSTADLACVDAIGALLKDSRDLRSVTVAVRLSDEDRVLGKGPEVAQAVASRLVKAGLALWRVSTVVPAARRGEASSLHIAYTQRPPPRPVAQVVAMTGEVRVGPETTDMKVTAAEALLGPGTWVSTQEAAFVQLRLADGSVLRLQPGSLMRVGRVSLTSKLRRRVKIDLVRGSVEAVVAPGGKGSGFDVITRIATAGVRGTTFRVAGQTEQTRIETLAGAVELTGSQGSVLVPAGMGSMVDGSGVPTPPRKLLPATAVIGPLRIADRHDGQLQWTSLDGAASWQVELASDAEFTWGVRTFRVKDSHAPVPTDLPAGKWFWRVTAVDADGFAGVPSKRHALQTVK